MTTKTALIGFTRAVALEMADRNITCNAVFPGSSPTPAIETRLAAFMASRQPSKRFVAMDNVAALVAFLCGTGGRDVTGAAIPIDGGWSAT